MKKILSAAVLPLLGLCLFGAAVLAIRRELRGHSLHGIADTIFSMPTNRLLLAILLTITCYILLTGYDSLGLRLLKMSVRYRRVAVASFIGFALSNNIGL